MCKTESKIVHSFSDGVLIICFSVDYLKQAESLYNELDLTGRGVFNF